MNARKLGVMVVMAAVLAAPVAFAQTPVGTAFAYQGQLKLLGTPVNDTADFEFTLWQDPNSVNPADQIGEMLPIDAVDVVDGLFNVVLDFEMGDKSIGAYDGNARWLQIAVRSPAGGGGYTTLTPRQELRPTPHAIWAQAVLGGITGTGTGNYIPKFTNGSTLADSVMYETAGRIGLGTQCPDGAYAMLHAHSGSSALIKITNDGTGQGYNDGTLFSYTTTAGKDACIWNREDASLVFATNNAERVRIASDGDVGIGTNDPYGKLHVEGGQLYVNNPGASVHTAIRVADAGGHGLLVSSAGDDGVNVADAGGDGVHVSFAGDAGIDASGDHGNHLRSDHNAYYGAYVHSLWDEPINPGLYVYGTFAATGTKSCIVETSQGQEALFCVEGPDVEFVTSGTATLADGEARVTFERLFREAISASVAIKVTATPKGTWSGLYVVDESSEGFTVRCGAGDTNASFDWVAIGRRKGYEQRPVIAVPVEEPQPAD